MQAHGLGGTFTDEADLTGSIHRFVKIGAADNGVIIAVDDTVEILGLIDSVPLAAGGAVGIQTVGIGRVELGGTVARGDRITAGALGRAFDYTVPGAAATNHSAGVALESGVVNEIIRMTLSPATNTGT